MSIAQAVFLLERGQTKKRNVTDTTGHPTHVLAAVVVGVIAVTVLLMLWFAGAFRRVTSCQVGDEGRAQIVSSDEEEQSARRPPAVGH